ncbi:MAG: exodeoxyribonuclease VII large subunit [Oligoflexales bacterium]|nr:exodeoxyribonuclease VII large subunit [Oligoflexales bacterium]
MSIHFQIRDELIILTGHTYPYREFIKNLGGRFEPQFKYWTIQLSEHNQNKIESLCRNAGGGQLAHHIVAETKVPSEVQLVSNIDTKVQIETSIKSEDLSIAEFLNKAANVIRNQFPAPIWVIGELQNLQKKSLGWFLQISESKDSSPTQTGTLTVNASVWQSQVKVILKKFPDFASWFQDGMKVRCLVLVNFYKDRAQVSLSIQDIDQEYSLGTIAQQRAKTIAELRQSGLYYLNKNQKLPRIALRIGLITAENSRAYSDFIDQLASKNFPGTVVFAAASMQGENCPTSVAAQIAHLDQKSCDLIVITRGGGSAADLRWFDDIVLASAICKCSTPIVAAIGHHEDTCIAEAVSFHREKTPTAAAEYVLQSISNFDLAVYECIVGLKNIMQRLFNQERSRLSLLESQLNNNSVNYLERQFFRLSHLQLKCRTQAEQVLQSIFYKTQELHDRLRFSGDKTMDMQLRRLEQLTSAIAQKDPQPWLKSGWTQLLLQKKPIKSVNEIYIEQVIKAVLIDGNVDLKVIKIDQETSKK